MLLIGDNTYLKIHENISRNYRLISAAGSVQLTFVNSQPTQQRTIFVTGEVVVRVEPDEVLIQCGVETHDMEIGTAKRDNAAIIESAIRLAKEHEIKDADLKTEYLGIEPRWQHSYKREDFHGYSHI